MTVLAGLDKEVRTMVRGALDDGWTARPTSKGHLFMTHPDGRTATVPSKKGSRRNLLNIAALLKGREDEKEEEMQPIIVGTVPGMDGPEDELWEPVGTEGRFERSGGTYRCTACAKEFHSSNAAGGHWSAAHAERRPRARRARVLREASQDAPVIVPTQAEQREAAEREREERIRMQEDTPQARIAALVQQEIGWLADEVARLTAENQRLRDALVALAGLAGEAVER